MKSFAELFKKYRLRAEFDTFTAFGNALAQKGYYYEDSIFSRWQKGTRIPSDRRLIINILQIFIDKEAIRSQEEANEFLASTKLGYLTSEEKEKLHINNLIRKPFQVPSEIAYFTGREETIKKIQHDITYGKVYILHGQPGVGKTALAIKLGHILKNKFPDGVLWYKVDSSNIMDILLSIARLFGEDISNIKDIEVRTSIVRTLLADKKILLIFDNVNKQDKLHSLLPNTSSCCVIFSSRESELNITTQCTLISVSIFTPEEVLSLFEKIYNKNFVLQYRKDIQEICKKVGNLPLAIRMIATHSKQFFVPLKTYIKELNEETLDLQTLTYEDKNLFRAISISFNKLENQAKNVFISLGVFEGKDFSLETVTFINKLPILKTEQVFRQLLNISFIEKSSSKRYRIHPIMKMFARKQINDSSIYLRAAFYYEKLLSEAQEKHSYKILIQEVDNIIYIFKKCYEFGYWDEIITLWNPIEKFLSDINEIKKLRILAETIDTQPSINTLQKILNLFMLFLLAYWIILFYSGLKTSFWNYLYSLLFSLMAFIGGFVGFTRSKHWRLFSSNVGKARFFISAGLFSWGCGGIIWAYYNFTQNIDVPYPSVADVSYFPAYFLWFVGVIYLSHATGAKFELKRKRSKLFLLVIPFFITTFSYYFLLFIVKRTYVSETPIKIFLDLAYPSMDIIILTFAIIIFGLSVNFFGGKYKLSVFAILLGFTFLYVGDFLFSYTTSLNIYFTGNFVDLSFSIGLYLLNLGTLSFYLTPKRNKNNLDQQDVVPFTRISKLIRGSGSSRTRMRQSRMTAQI